MHPLKPVVLQIPSLPLKRGLEEGLLQPLVLVDSSPEIGTLTA
jgi:hypothetical protein